MNRRAEQPFARSDEAAAAVVTGASSGIGAVFARELARRGYDLLLVARREALLGELAEELASAHGVAAAACPADLSRPDGVERVRRRVAETPNLEMLVNNAGFGMHGDFTEVGFHDSGQYRFDRSRIPPRLWMSAEDVVAASLKALGGKRVVCIPGWKNRLFVRLARSWISGPIISAVFSK